MNMELREKQRTEAVRRMEALHLPKCVILDFEKDDNIWISELCGLNSLDEKTLQIVREFENDTGYLAYHVVEHRIFDKKYLNIFFVSDYDEYWGHERSKICFGTDCVLCIKVDSYLCVFDSVEYSDCHKEYTDVLFTQHYKKRHIIRTA